ncbi:MAG: DUF1559 domain-containing protein [Planctomycetia bacterium]
MVRSRSSRGFTLVELLVVIAIIGVLVGLLLPAVQAAREAGRRSSCQNNAKQLGLAGVTYHDAKKTFPSGYTQDKISGSFQGHTVFYFLLPFMEQQTIFDTMSATNPLNNRSATPGTKAAAAISTLVCASDRFPEGNPHQFSATEWYGVTTYRANGGSRPIFATSSTNDGVFMATGTSSRAAAGAPAWMLVNVKHVTDGTSKTIMFGESSHVDENFNTFTKAGWNSGSTISTWSRWYPAGGDSGLGNIMCGAYSPINYTTPWAHGQPGAPGSSSAWYDYQDRRLSAIGSNHPGGADVVFCDGSVRFLNDSVSQTMLSYYCVRNDNQLITD